MKFNRKYWEISECESDEIKSKMLSNAINQLNKIEIIFKIQRRVSTVNFD